MAHIGKRIAKAREGIERTKLYPLDEAVKLVQASGPTPSSTRRSRSR